MKTPMILPWLAKKAGIPEDRAEELWHDALRHATLTTGWVNSPEYWGVALDKLEELVAAESAETCHASIIPMMRVQHDLNDLQLTAWEGMMRAANEAWSRLYAGAR